MSDKKPQHGKFIDKARDLGCDESEAAFDEKLRRLVMAPSKQRKKKTPAK